MEKIDRTRLIDKTLQQQLQTELKNRFQMLQELDPPQEIKIDMSWSSLHDSITDATITVVSFQTSKSIV